MPPEESWSWRKFFGGFFNGKNFAKAIVIGVCQVLILVILISVISTFRSFSKSKALPTQSVGSNTGTITTNSEDNRKGTVVQLFKSLIDFGGS